MHKLKTALRSSHRKRDSTSSQSPRHSYDSSDAASPRADNHTTSSSPYQNGRASLDAYHGQPQHGRRSRPVSSAYDDHRRASNASSSHYVPTGVPVGTALTTPDSVNGAIAHDYKSYLPALSPVDDFNGDSYMTSGTDARLMATGSDGRHGEPVADRNTAPYRSSIDASRNKPLPVAPNPAHAMQQQPRFVGGNATTRSGLGDGLQPRQQPLEHSRNDNGFPIQSVPNQTQLGSNRNYPQGLESGRTRPQEASLDRRDMAVPSAHSPVDRQAAVNGRHQDGDTQDWKTHQKSLLSGVVDLRNTVDTDKDVQLAAPVVHEVIKPHEHEVVQRKIYREVHNYSYYHRLQPVMHTEVLSPRHFIPNPNGEGLIEISADELPMRTGKNRWWEIMQREVPQTFEIQSRWRTEPEIIQGEPYITKEGFERKETTIIYPPKLEDMSDYEGLVQTVHFDHKTGERWLGEVTTMAKLQQHRERHDQDTLTMRELTESLPDVPASPTVRRKPVGASNAI